MHMNEDRDELEKSKLEEQERRRQELLGSLAGRNAGNALAAGIDQGTITAPGQIAETFNSSLASTGQRGAVFRDAALANAADGVDYAGQEVARQMEAEHQLTGRRILNLGARDMFAATDGNFKNRNFKNTLGLLKGVGRDHGVPADAVNSDLFKAGLEAVDQAGQEGNILKAAAVADALLASGLVEQASPDADGRDGFSQLLEKRKAAVHAASSREEKDAEAVEAERAAAQAQAYTGLVDTLAAADTTEKIAEVAATGMENDPNAIETYGHRIDSASSLASNQAKFLTSGEKPDENEETVASLFQRLDAGDKDLLHDDEALDRHAPNLLPEQLKELREHRDNLRKNPGAVRESVVEKALDDIKVKIMGARSPVPSGIRTKIKGFSEPVGLFSDLSMTGPDGEEILTTKGREVQKAMEEAWQSVDAQAYDGKPSQLAAARIRAVEQVRDDALAASGMENAQENPDDVAKLLAARPQDLNNPAARERLLRLVAPPDADAVTVLNNVSNLRNGETQEELKTMLANKNMEKVLENMGVEPPPKRMHLRSRKQKPEPFIATPTGKPEDSMEDVFQEAAAALSDPNLSGQFLRESAATASNEDVGLWGNLSSYGKAAATGVRNGYWYSGPESLLHVTKRLGLWTGSESLTTFAGQHLESLALERQNDPWAQPDPDWEKSFIASSLYNGLDGVTSSLTQMLAAAPLAMAGAKLAPVAGVTALTGAFLGSALGTNGLQAVAEIDRFADEAFQELQKINPAITREEVEDKHFWDAIQSGVVEGGMGFVSDALTGKLLKLVTKGLPTNLAGEALDKAQREALVEQARGVVAKAFRNSSRAVLTEVPGELATAHIQNNIKKNAGLESVSTAEALKQALGPALVGAGAFGLGSTIAKGVNNKLKPGESPAGILSLKGEGDALAADLQTAVQKDRYGEIGHEFIQERLVASEMGPETGLAVGELLNDEAARWAEKNGKSRDEWWAKTKEKYDAHKGADWSSLSSLAQALITPDQSFDTLVGNSLDSLSAALTPEQKASLGDGNIGETFKQWLKDPDQADGLKPETVESFAAMRDKLLGSYGTLKEAGAVRISPETQALFDNLMKKTGMREAAPPNIYTVKDKEGLAKQLAGLVENTPENNNKIVQEFLKHSDYNFSPWTLGSDIQAVFATIDQAMAPYLEPMLTPQHNADMDAKALADMKENGYSPDSISSLFKDVVGGKDGTISQQLRKALIYQSLALQNTHKLAAEYNRDPSARNAAAFIAATEVCSGIHAEMRGVRSEAGRFLNAFKSAGKDHNYDMDRISAMIEDRGGEKTVKTLAEFVLTANSPDDLVKKMEGGTLRKFREAIREHHALGLLTAARTHVTNIVGNSSLLPWELGVRKLAEMDNPLSDAGVAKGETRAMVNGMVAGVKAFGRSLHNLKEAQGGGYGKALLHMQDMELEFQDSRGSALLNDYGVMERKITGETAKEVFDAVVPGKDSKYLSSAHAAASNGLSVVADLWGKALNVSGSLLHGEDMFFKSIAAHAELYARAHRHAAHEQSKGGDYKTSHEKFMKKPPKDDLLAIQEYAKKLTFQDDLGKLASGVDKIRKSMPESSLFMPFLKTPVNILKYNISHLPEVNKVLGEVRKELNSKDPARRQIAEARTIMGGLLITATMGLVESGVLTGGGPPSADERKKMEATGRQANSLRIGDTYVNISTADPLATYLNSVASLYELGPHLQGEEATQMFLTTMGAVQRVVKDKSYLRGLSDLIAFADDVGSHKSQRVVSNIAASLAVPASSLVNSTAQMLDPFARDTSTFGNLLRSRIPGLSKDVPIRRNFLGEPIERNRAPLGLNPVIPSSLSKDKKDPLYNEVLRLTQAGYKIQGEMSNEHGKVKLDAKTYDRLNEHVHLKFLMGGQNCVDTLRDKLDSRLYQAMDDETRAKDIVKTITEFRRAGKVNLMRNDPDFRYQIGK